MDIIITIPIVSFLITNYQLSTHPSIIRFRGIAFDLKTICGDEKFCDSNLAPIFHLEH